MDWDNICSDADAVLICCGEERAELKVKLLIYQSVHWAQIQAAEISFLRRVARLSLRYRVRSLVIQEGPSRTTAPPHRKKPVEVV